MGLGLLLTLILPVSVAILSDWWLATSPFLTMAASLICIPLATVVVIRMALKELDRVIAEVAPPDPVEVEDVAPNSNGDGLPDASV